MSKIDIVFKQRESFVIYIFFYSWPTIYDAGPALNQHSASSRPTQRPNIMRPSLRVLLRVRLRRVHKALYKTLMTKCKSFYYRILL